MTTLQTWIQPICFIRSHEFTHWGYLTISCCCCFHPRRRHIKLTKIGHSCLVVMLLLLNWVVALIWSINWTTVIWLLSLLLLLPVSGEFTQPIQYLDGIKMDGFKWEEEEKRGRIRTTDCWLCCPLSKKKHGVIGARCVLFKNHFG